MWPQTINTTTTTIIVTAKGHKSSWRIVNSVHPQISWNYYFGFPELAPLKGKAAQWERWWTRGEESQSHSWTQPKVLPLCYWSLEEERGQRIDLLWNYFHADNRFQIISSSSTGDGVKWVRQITPPNGLSNRNLAKVSSISSILESCQSMGTLKF